MGYNFDPMMGQPLQLSISSSYPFLSQSPGMPFPTSITPNVEPPSHSSQLVVGGMIPTITVSLSAVETTLSASPRLTPRVSTSSANVARGDVQRVIQQHPLSSPNTVLIGAGIGRGQVLAQKLMKAGIGKGRSIPSSKAMRPEECRGHADASTSVDIPPPITLRLNHQGPPVSYSEVASRPPRRRLLLRITYGCVMCT